jgi:hypothetical protein
VSPDSGSPGPEEDLARLPGFGTAPAPRPSRRAPDPPSPEDGEAAGAAAPSEPQRPLTPPSFGKQAGAFTAIARALLIAAAGYLNMVTAVDEQDTAFLTDEDDERLIPPPLGRIAARRIKLGQLAENYTDLQDIGEAAVGLLAWLAKGITASLSARRERKRAEHGKTVATGLQPAEPAQ